MRRLRRAASSILAGVDGVVAQISIDLDTFRQKEIRALVESELLRVLISRKKRDKLGVLPLISFDAGYNGIVGSAESARACPFCGCSELSLCWRVRRASNELALFYHVNCDSCGADGPGYFTKEGAVRQWNHR